MELNLESDADDLWQDAMDLLAAQGTGSAMLAMLSNCVPVKLENGVLHVETSMRMVAKNVSKNAAAIEACLAQAAFEPTKLSLEFVPGRPTAAQPAVTAASEKPAPATPAPTISLGSSSMSAEEAARWTADTTPSAPVQASSKLADDAWDEEAARIDTEARARARREKNPLVDDVQEGDSKLTFDRFVCGDENELAYNAAIQVANGNKAYNPLFIYGKSGLGKTHLLRAIQNYIAENDPSRICVYRDASSFITDYTTAMKRSDMGAPEALRRNYADIDVLIIDDVQSLAGKAGTIKFFFDTFNDLKAHGKQIVLAADRTPAELGMGKDGFDERVTSRINSGTILSVQVPSFELKYKLISTFCTRIREDAIREHVGNLGPLPQIEEPILRHMAERAGSNIRSIEGFCQSCLETARATERAGRTFDNEDVDEIAKSIWVTKHRAISIEDVQRQVEKFYGISHEDLIGNKRNREIMEPRHVAIYLSRELCNKTFVEIGKNFGGRSHATVMHSIRIVEKERNEDKVFYDQLMRVREAISNDS